MTGVLLLASAEVSVAYGERLKRGCGDEVRAELASLVLEAL